MFPQYIIRIVRLEKNFHALIHTTIDTEKQRDRRRFPRQCLH